MFAVSVAVVAAHFYFAPPPHAGVYAPRMDGALGTTFWTYWRWVLGPMPAAIGGRRSGVRARADRLGAATPRCTALFGAAWFVIAVAAVPAAARSQDGLLPRGARRSASRWWAHLRSRDCGKFGRFRRVAIVAGDRWCMRGVRLQASWTVTRWQHARGGEGGRPGARRGGSAPGGAGEDHSAGRDR